MFEWIVMGFFIGGPLVLMVGALVAWLYQHRQEVQGEERGIGGPEVSVRGSRRGGDSPDREGHEEGEQGQVEQRSGSF